MENRSSEYGQELAGQLLDRLSKAGIEQQTNGEISLVRNPDGQSYSVQMKVDWQHPLAGLSPYEAILIALSPIWDSAYQAIFDQVTRQFDAEYTPAASNLRTQDRLILAYRATMNRLAPGDRFIHFEL